MGRKSRITVSWSDLPQELVEKIASCFDNETDVRRFRAICSSWRSFTTPFKKLPLANLKLPFLYNTVEETIDPDYDGPYFTLLERTVYRFQLPECKEQPNFWLVKTEASKDGKLRILNPLNHLEIKILPENKMPKVLNTLDFRVSEVCKSYALRYVNPSNPNHNDDFKVVKKVAVSASVEKKECVVVGIDGCYRLWYIKSDDETWTMVDIDCSSFLDVINYKGQFCVFDFDARLWFFDSQIEFTITSSLSNDYDSLKRHLVELSDELFHVMKVTDKHNKPCTCRDIAIGCQCCSDPVKNTVVEIRISRFDKSREFFDGEAEIDGVIVFVGDDCSFSVSAEGVKGFRVFYTDRYIRFRTDEEQSDECFNHDSDPYFVGNYGCGYSCSGSCNCCELFSNAAIDSFVPSDDVKLKFRGLHGHNIGVWDFETGKMGSLMMFPDYADVFWPPPSWLSRRN